MIAKNIWKILTLATGLLILTFLGLISYSYLKSGIGIVEAKDAVKALQKLDAATEVGVNKIEYAKMLIDAQALVNQASEKLPDGELKQEIKLAMDNYMDAKTLWYLMKEDTFVFVCENEPDPTNSTDVGKALLKWMCDPIGSDLQRKYKLPIRPYLGQKIVENGKGELVKEEGISIIWTKAKEHVNRASSLLNK